MAFFEIGEKILSQLLGADWKEFDFLTTIEKKREIVSQ
jgi:hypothetical protein